MIAFLSQITIFKVCGKVRNFKWKIFFKFCGLLRISELYIKFNFLKYLDIPSRSANVNKYFGLFATHFYQT